MGQDGHYNLVFNYQISAYELPKKVDNPRFCFAMREKGTQDDWDIMVASMKTWESKLWSMKDGMTDNPESFCVLAWEDEAEEVNDWINDDLE